MRSSSFIAGIVLFLITGGLMAADLVFRELPRQTINTIATDQDDGTPTTNLTETIEPESTTTSSVSSTRVVKKGSSTKKTSGIDVQEVLRTLELVPEETSEVGFLSFLVTDKTNVQTSVLLKDNDRAFFFSWVDDDNIKPLFSGLKKALSEQFSGKLTNLIDETITSDSGPIVDVLSFTDPELSPEKITFLRIRSRLYEIRTAANGLERENALIEALSK